ncbi:hypothetical protein IT411_02850 [Candidatus Peregrinibacteria bacterium]|nr:hypothetical protein [Candidatus Peregrinibacteria bacterium]
MKQPSKPKSYSLKKRLAIVALAGTAATAERIDAFHTEDQLKKISDGIVTEQMSIPENLIPPEQLPALYEQVKIRRDIFKEVAGTRHNLRKLLGFLWQAGPNMIKTALGSKEDISYQTLDEAGIEREKMAVLVDLSAFDLKRFRNDDLNFDVLVNNKVREIVLMEDRDPQFFLNYADYQADQVVPLNRHGSKEDKWTMADLKKLIAQLQEKKIKVIIGFWGNTGNKDGNDFIKRNWDNLAPVIPSSDDINPLSMVRNGDDKEMSCADYIVEQYRKLDRDFGFDGLFLGDGLMGFRSFLDPNGDYNTADFNQLWTDFYRKIYEGVKETGNEDTLWAYDCMANGQKRAQKNGLNLEGIAKYIDNYIFQSYANDAWGSDYMNLPGYDLNRDKVQSLDLPDALKVKTRYSVGIGDNVEGWAGKAKNIGEKHVQIGPQAKRGSLGVWSNGLIRGIL